MSHVFQVPAGTMADQLSALPKAPQFTFDLLEHISNLHSEMLRKSLLSALAFSCNGLIVARLRSTMFDAKRNMEVDGTATWDDYQSYLTHVASIEFEHELKTEMGLDSVSYRKDMRGLVEIRGECYRMIDGDRLVPATVPTIEEVILNPRMRSLDANTLLKAELMAEDEAPEDREEIISAYKQKDAVQRKLRHEQDKAQGKSLVALWRALKIDEDGHLWYYDDNVNFFERISPPMQLKLLRGAFNAVASTRTRMISDFRVDPMEFAKARIELKPYAADIEQAMAHARFDDIRDTVLRQ